ncbi:MAG: hypothetical protein Q9163_003318 [Psora crenata]
MNKHTSQRNKFTSPNTPLVANDGHEERIKALEYKYDNLKATTDTLCDPVKMTTLRENLERVREENVDLRAELSKSKPELEKLKIKTDELRYERGQAREQYDLKCKESESFRSLLEIGSQARKRDEADVERKVREIKSQYDVRGPINRNVAPEATGNSTHFQSRKRLHEGGSVGKWFMEVPFPTILPYPQHWLQSVL